MKSTDGANLFISAQDVPLDLQRTGLWLYRHECSRLDPATGKRYASSKALNNVLKWMYETQARQERIKKALTVQQRELVQMLVSGMTQAQIGLELGINIRNLRKRFARIRRRLGVETMYQVVAVCVQYGWASADDL